MEELRLDEDFMQNNLDCERMGAYWSASAIKPSIKKSEIIRKHIQMIQLDPIKNYSTSRLI